MFICESEMGLLNMVIDQVLLPLVGVVSIVIGERDLGPHVVWVYA